MGIRITNKNAKCPEGYKLASKIVTYLFEQEDRELRHMTKEEIETIRKAANILAR